MLLKLPDGSSSSSILSATDAIVPFALDLLNAETCRVLLMDGAGQFLDGDCRLIFEVAVLQAFASVFVVVTIIIIIFIFFLVGAVRSVKFISLEAIIPLLVRRYFEAAAFTVLVVGDSFADDITRFRQELTFLPILFDEPVSMRTYILEIR